MEKERRGDSYVWQKDKYVLNKWSVHKKLISKKAKHLHFTIKTPFKVYISIIIENSQTFKT